jgi:hypothetical protein
MRRSRMHPRIFVEWFDPARPNWGGYINSETPDFQRDLVMFIELFGPPTKVEYRDKYEGTAP